MPYVAPSSIAMDFPGLCLTEWRIFLLAGGRGVTLECGCLEDGASLPYVEPMEGKK